MFLPIFLLLAQPAFAALSTTGNITLFSDTACTDAVFINSYILGRDVCGKAGTDTGDVFQSYILNERPWCTNGSRPYFNVYGGETCSGLIASYEPGPLYNPTGPDADGTCVAPVMNYKALAFICDGFEGAWGTGASTQMPSTSATMTPTAVSTISRAISTSSAIVLSTRTSTSEPPISTTSSVQDTATGTATTALLSISSITEATTGTTSTAPSSVSTAGAAWTSPGIDLVFACVVPLALLAL